MARCLDNETLERLAYGKLSDAETAAAEAHITACRRCAEALARVPAGAELIERVRDVQKAREEIGPALERLSETEERVTTTLFGRK